MKQLFFIGAIVALTSCGGTETDTSIVPTGDSSQGDTTRVNTSFNTDSIETVGELLDSLEAVEPVVKMTH